MVRVLLAIEARVSIDVDWKSGILLAILTMGRCAVEGLDDIDTLFRLKPLNDGGFYEILHHS